MEMKKTSALCLHRSVDVAMQPLITIEMFTRVPKEEEEEEGLLPMLLNSGLHLLAIVATANRNIKAII